jgi:hypothetical protein
VAPRIADRYSASNSRTAVAAVHIGRGALRLLPRLHVVETGRTELRENGVVADMGPQTDGRTDRRLFHTRRSLFVSYRTSEN